MTDDILLIDTDERVRTLTLNRPQSRNALSAALRDRFFAALADAEADDDIDVVILTGADPVFCAGLDLKELAGQTALPDISPRWPAYQAGVGAINGAAVTGGHAPLPEPDRLRAPASRHPRPPGPAAQPGDSACAGRKRSASAWPGG
ncbi:enoyl-CoA hydratase [Mycobacterium tuberculosis CAS/NITR204]|uniref:Enoyl-CoA hydratase n=1 Tax=Mycobacterium tuberculosis CAS/NITR204 TaxID=1310114 RepID=R4MJY3_MYCTX|nr:enoyl-CoA hydratase [Mycobacterium tuberculosis CAS/NITR204]